MIGDWWVLKASRANEQHVPTETALVVINDPPGVWRRVLLGDDGRGPMLGWWA